MVAIVGLLSPQVARAVGLTYVDAAAEVAPNLSPLGSIVFTNDNADNFWGRRTFGAVNTVNTRTIFESGIEEDSPQISQTISGLTPGNSYDMYVVYWSDPADWQIQAGVSSGNLTLFNRLGPTAALPAAQAGTLALMNAWDVPPVDTVGSPAFLEGNRTMFIALAGTAVANGSGQAQVFIDDTASAGGNGRTWLDGVAYAPAGTSVQLMLGDFNGSGGTANLADYQTLLNNIHTDVSGLTLAETYSRGDINLDQTIDYFDFSQFAMEYDLQNGGGSFAAMASAVPEPEAVFLLALGGLLVAVSRWQNRLWKGCVKIRAPAASFGLALAVLVGASSCILLSGAATAAPATGWTIDTSFGGGMAGTTVLTNNLTDSPTLGDGTTDNANNAAMYASIPNVTLSPGQQIVLTGSVDAVGGNPFASPLNSFRYGLFLEDAQPPTTFGWLGHWVQNSTSGRNGNIASRDPAGTDFESVTFASITQGRAKTLSLGGNEEPFVDGTYNFNLTIGRFDDNSTTAHAVMTSASGYSLEVYRATETNPSNLTFEFNRVGFLSASVFMADQMQFDDINVSVQSIVAPRMQVSPSGAVTIVNTTGAPLDLKYYEITSDAGMLNTGGWTTIDSTEGGDPVGTGWDPAVSSNQFVLSEGNLEGSMTLAAGASLSLGNAAQNGADDLRFFYGLADGSTFRGLVQYASVPGDFDGDGDVDGADFVVWQTNFPTQMGATLATGDADGDGDVDGADFVIWQTNFPFTPSPGAAAVPEPTALILAACGLGACAATLRRRRRPMGG